jgi:hypothetical protein
MVAIAQSRLPAGLTLQADALALPFPDQAFERVFTGHFYGHLPEFKRFLSGPQLAAEIDGTVLMDGRWFVAAASGH